MLAKVLSLTTVQPCFSSEQKIIIFTLLSLWQGVPQSQRRGRGRFWLSGAAEVCKRVARKCQRYCSSWVSAAAEYRLFLVRFSDRPRLRLILTVFGGMCSDVKQQLLKCCNFIAQTKLPNFQTDRPAFPAWVTPSSRGWFIVLKIPVYSRR